MKLVTGMTFLNTSSFHKPVVLSSENHMFSEILQMYVFDKEINLDRYVSDISGHYEHVF